jgi:hypothetical protein
MPRAVKFSRDCSPSPISAVHPLEQVQEAYRQVQRRHARGKIVLSPVPPDERDAVADRPRAGRHLPPDPGSPRP